MGEMRTLTGNEFRRLGVALYGKRWKTSLSRDLGISTRYISMLVVGDRQMPPGLTVDLERLCNERLAIIDRWHRKLVDRIYPRRSVNAK